MIVRNVLCKQVLIEAYDDAGAATRSSTGTLTIDVNRNLNPPRFLTQTYNYEILEIQAVNIPFLFVQAQDDDTVVSYCFYFVSKFMQSSLCSRKSSL